MRGTVRSSVLAEAQAPSGTLPSVSVVVPTCNRPMMLQRCLDAVLAQRGVGCMEIVVVDDARSPLQRETLEVRYGASPIPVRYVAGSETAHGPAAARNIGWRAAHSNVIAFTDDDTIPTSTWLHEGLLTLEESADAAWGHVTVPLSPRPTDGERNTGGLDGAEFITANCFVRRAALERVGGFDERFKRPWREDSDLYFTLLEAGMRVAKAPSAIVVHPARPTRPGTSIRLHGNLLFEALLFKKHPRLYREKIGSGPPWRYYATVAAAFAAAIAFLADARVFAAAAFAMWLLLTVRLVFRRLAGTSRHWLNVADIIASSLVIPFVAVMWRIGGAIRYRVLFL